MSPAIERLDPIMLGRRTTFQRPAVRIGDAVLEKFGEDSKNDRFTGLNIITGRGQSPQSKNSTEDRIEDSRRTSKIDEPALIS